MKHVFLLSISRYSGVKCIQTLLKMSLKVVLSANGSVDLSHIYVSKIIITCCHLLKRYVNFLISAFLKTHQCILIINYY